MMIRSILCLFILLLLIKTSTNARILPDDRPAPAAMQALLNNSSLIFTENKGQITDKAGKERKDILYTANSGHTQLFLSHNCIYYQFTKIIYPEGYNPSASRDDVVKYMEAAKKTEVQTHRFSLELVGGDTTALVREENPDNSVLNFYQASATNGITGVNSYRKIVYQDIYPHIDWVIYSQGPGLKYDFIVHPGGNPALIKLKISDADQVEITGEGELLMKTRLGEVREKAPLSFSDGRKVASSFKRNNDGTIGFDVKASPGATLVIDPVVMWATYYGGAAYDDACDISVDTLGYVYVAGTSSSTTAIADAGFQTSFGGGISDIFLAKFDDSGTRIWATYYGGNDQDVGYSCAADNYGNVFLAGLASSAGLASGGFQDSLTATSQTAPGSIILVKFNAATGTRFWATYYGNYVQPGGNDCLCTDPAGNVYIVGAPAETGLASAGFQNTPGGSQDALLVKFNTSGSRLWATYYGGSGYDVGSGAQCDNAGNVYLVGWTASTGLSSSGFQNTLSGSSTDAFLVKFNAAGNRLWATYYGGSQADRGRSCVIDSVGNVFLIGETSSTSTIASGGFQNTFGGAGVTLDGFVAKFDASGANRLWGTYYGGTANETFYSGTLDHAGNLIVSGIANSSGLSGSGFQNAIAGGQDAILVKFNGAGNRLWASYFGGSSYEGWDAGCAVDSLNNIYMVGGTSSSSGISIPGTHQPVYGGGNDGYLIKVGDVNLITDTTIAGPFCAGSTISVPYTISGIYNAINVFTAQLSDASGSFASPVNIGTLTGTAAGMISATIPLNTPPGTAYRIRVVSSSPVIVAPNNGFNLVIAGAGSVTTVTDTVCSSALPYVWHGINVSSGGTAVASDTFQNAGGCDSVLLLDLVVKQAPAPLTVNDTICRNNLPLTWNGINVIAPPSGNTATATYTGVAANGCDSIVTLALFIRDTSAVTDYKVYCRDVLPVVWNGITIPATANTNASYATYTTTNAGGCDSIVQLNLTVNDPVALTVYDTVCSNVFPMLWNGISIAAPSGNTTTAVYNTQTVNNCDSIVTLNLYVKQSSVNTVNVTVCSNQLPYLWNGIFVNTGGPAAAVYTTPNAVGCDSVVTLNLTVNNTSVYTHAITICSNQLPYTWNGINVTTGGTAAAIYTTQNVAGCDSVVTLNLTVNNTSASTVNTTICASDLPYSWNGMNVATGGAAAAVYTTPNAAGCDSVVTLNLTVVSGVVPVINITAFPGNSISPGTAVTFTAAITNGGTAPVLQWKKNGMNVGTNSATYTDFNIDSGDVITCILTSSITCAFPNDVVSNAITMTVITPPPPCQVPVTLISTDIQFSSAVFKWATVVNALGYEVALDMMPGNPSSGMFTTDTAYHASAMLPGIHYFHIRTRCAGGDLSPWITITITIQDGSGTTGVPGLITGAKGLMIYPNPNNGIFNVSGNIAGDKAYIDIIDKSGRLIYKSEANSPGGKLDHHIDLFRKLTSGIYMLRVVSGNEVYAIRFVYE